MIKTYIYIHTHTHSVENVSYAEGGLPIPDPQSSTLHPGDSDVCQFKKYPSRDFRGGPVAKTLHSQFKRPGCDPWSGNWIAHATIKDPAYHN